MKFLQQATVSCLLIFFFITTTYSQDSLQITNTQIILESNNLSGLSQLTEEQLEDLDQAVLDSIFTARNFFVTAAIYVSDTSNIQAIYLRLGRTMGASDLANVVIPYNGNLPNGVVGLLKDEKELQVEFGEHSNTTPLYLEVWIDDRQGNTTPVYQSSTL